MSSNSKPFARWPEFEIRHREATVKRPRPQPTIPPAAGGDELFKNIFSKTLRPGSSNMQQTRDVSPGTQKAKENMKKDWLADLFKP